MEMLDASLAFALTLAALSTVVTIILEALHRLLRVRKWNLILTMKKLSVDVAKDGFIVGPTCWDFVVGVLNNGTHPKTQKLLNAKDMLAAKPVKQGFLPWLWDSVFTLSFNDVKVPGKKHEGLVNKNASAIVNVIAKVLRPLKNLLLGEKIEPGDQPKGDWMTAIASLNRRHATRAVFDKVSVEHILRRFVELPEVKDQLEQNRVKVEAQLDKISRKYEEFASSVTADFKRRARMWSIFIGVILAFSVNIDATRIFEAYLKDKTLTSNVIKNYEKFEKNAGEAQTKLKEVIKDVNDGNSEKAVKELADKQKELDKLKEQKKTADKNKIAGVEEQISDVQKEIDKLIAQAYANSDVGRAQQAMKEAGMQLHSLSVLGVPIGNSYFPHCMLINKADATTAAIQGNKKAKKGGLSKVSVWLDKWFEGTTPIKTKDTDSKKKGSVVNHCLTGQTKKPWLSPFIGWLLTAGITGILIGLGAPFWFDVARRIAEVRSMFNGKQDNEQRMAGKDVDGDAEQRKELVKNVVKDAVADQKLKVTSPVSGKS